MTDQDALRKEENTRLAQHLKAIRDIMDHEADNYRAFQRAFRDRAKDMA